MHRFIFSTAGCRAAVTTVARGGAVVAGVMTLSACGQTFFAMPSHSASASAQPAGDLMGAPDPAARSAASRYASVSMAPIPNPGDPGAAAYYRTGETHAHRRRHVDVGSGDPVSIPVSYADLNLANGDGAAAFKGRIKRAIKDICGDADMHDLERTAMVRACRNQLWSQNQGQVQQAIAQAHIPATSGAGSVTLAAR